MPIQLEIFHPDRILIGVARGNVTLQEYGEFVAEVVKANLMHYRKIIDAAGAESAVIDQEVLLAHDLAQGTRAHPVGQRPERFPPRRRGGHGGGRPAGMGREEIIGACRSRPSPAAG